MKIFCAADLGAGGIKIKASAVGMPATLAYLPSLLSWAEEKNILVGDARLVDPAAFGLGGRWYFAGESVSDRLLSAEDVAASPILKVENALPLLLACLIKKVKLRPGQYEVCLVASHHDPNSMGALLREKLEGAHTVIKAGEEYGFTVKLPRVGIVGEGSALNVAVDDGCEGYGFGVLDLGYLTSIFSLRDDDGAIVRATEPKANGTHKLIGMLSQHQEFRALLGGVCPDLDAIAIALVEASREKKNKLFYRRGGKAIDFTAVYGKVMPAWIKQAAGDARLSIQERQGTPYQAIAIGGGCNLPGVAPTLKSVGIKVSKDLDPIFANVESIYLKHVKPAMKSGEFAASKAEMQHD